MRARPRCPIHGTVLDPDGNCALCRSRAPDDPPAHWGRLVLGLTVVVVSLGLFIRHRSHLAPSLAGDISGSSSTRPRDENDETRAVTSRSADLPSNVPISSRFEHAEFTERDPRGFRAELHARGERELSGDYQARDESFEMVVPSAANTDSLGVLVWISATQSGKLPNAEWAPILATHRLVFIAPNRAGNEREIASRLGLALDSLLAARRRVNLDSHRVFIGGISGGAKTAFRALLYFPEIFRGAVLCAGIEYIRDVPIQSRSGSFWPQRIGTPSDLVLAKLRPIAITTGPKDFNYAQIHDVVAALGKDQFSHVVTFESPELAHENPPASMLDQALTWLDERAK